MSIIKRSCLGAIALVAAFAAVAPSGAAAACTPHLYFSGSVYHVRICGLPDYDQERIAASNLGAAHYNFTGLFDNGRCHCVPTSYMNALGYYNSKGLTGVKPKNFAWNSRSFNDQNEPGMGGVTSASYGTAGYSSTEATRYEETNTLLKTLGQVSGVVSTSTKCGTSFSKLVGGADFLIDTLSQGVDFTYTFSQNKPTIPKDMAVALANGATVLFAYGRREVLSESEGQPVVLGPRKGGHVMTLRGVYGGNSTATLSLRDPANDEADQSGKVDRVRQSHFKTTFQDLKKRTAVFENAVGTQWQSGDIYTDSKGVRKARFVDGWMAIWPQVYVGIDAAGFSVTGFLLNFGSGRSAGAARALPTSSKRFNVGPVLDATYVARTGEVVFVRKGSSTLEAINIASKQRRSLGAAPTGFVDLDTDAKRGEVLALGGSELQRIPMEPGAKRTIKSLSGFSALAYDNTETRDQVAAVKADGSVKLFQGAALATPRTRTLPSRYTAGKGRLVASFDSNGLLLLRREGSNMIQRAAVTNGFAPRSTIKSSSVGQGGGFVATNDGTVLTVIDGKLAELKTDGTRVSNSRFAGVSLTGKIVSLIRPGVDLSAALAPALADERVDDDPNVPEFSTGLPPAGAMPLATFEDDEADAKMDAMQAAGAARSAERQWGGARDHSPGRRHSTMS